MQFIPDWHAIFDKDRFETNFGKLSGPGLYLTATDTMLVVANPPHTDVTPENMWHQRWPKGTLWHVYLWNSPLRNTFWAVIGRVPTRLDTR